MEVKKPNPPAAKIYFFTFAVIYIHLSPAPF
jgi:hypothetical protein